MQILDHAFDRLGLEGSSVRHLPHSFSTLHTKTFFCQNFTYHASYMHVHTAVRILWPGPLASRAYVSDARCHILCSSRSAPATPFIRAPRWLSSPSRCTGCPLSVPHPTSYIIHHTSYIIHHTSHTIHQTELTRQRAYLQE